MPNSVVFLGTSAFAVPSLKALAQDSDFDIKIVITQPDRPTGRKQILTASPVKIAAQELNLPIAQPEKINSLLVETQNLASLPRPDFLIVVSYGQILSQEILDWPTKAAVNVHASLLPQLRGASPLQHAILQQLPVSGVTVQRMAKELDAGPILGQTSVPLDARETFTSLHDKLAQLGASLLVTTLKAPLHDTPQDASKVTFCSKLTKADGIADPQTMPAEHIDAMVRALTPWPAVTLGENKLLETSLEPAELMIPCAQGTTLSILRIQPAGGTPMTGADFLRGHKKL